MDDMIVKRKIIDIHLVNLAEMFQMLKRFDMVINPSKCTFAVNLKKFFKFIVH